MRLANAPSLSIPVESAVRDAVERMVQGGHGAVAVTEGGRLVGVFTERDLMDKVVHPGLDPARTPVRDVMARDPVSVCCGTRRSEALAIMLEKHFRHLPICDEENRPIGMLSFRDLLSHQVSRLRNEVDSLEAYLLADGPGG
jgi:CBS domain-containing protein